MKKTGRLRSSLTVNIIGAIVGLILFFGVVVSTIGYISFTNAFKREYATSTYHMADTATTLVDGDSIDAYLDGDKKYAYQLTDSRLRLYCERIHVSLVYVIKVDTSDYGRFVSVFNEVNNEVDNSSYTPWELGFERNTTNDEYRAKYKAIYEDGSAYETVYRTNTTGGVHPHITTIVPVKGSDGTVKALLCMQRPISELNTARRPYLINIAISSVALAILTSLFYLFYIRHQFVFPLRKVADEATRFAKENTKGEDLKGISKFAELSRLAGSIDKMETDMVTYMENLTAATAERERIGTELALASTIQENSIPNIFPPYPDRMEFDIFASMTPAKEVGGDFYNFFLLDDSHLAFVIGDVSGKGVPAALFMMVTNIVLSDRARMGGTPSEIMAFVNDSISSHNKADMFVTLWFGILDLATGKVTAANAGHDDAAVYRKDGSFELFETKHNIVVGAMESVPFRDFEIQLGHGDKLFLYTDGVPEATDANNKMFGMDRLLVTLNECKEKTPEAILKGVHESVNAFVGDAPQFDDLTMLAIEYK